MASFTRASWLVPVSLLALAFIPVVAGAFRLTTLLTGAEVTPENVRFFSAPVPVMLHIVSVIIYSVIGAFQFVPSLRRGRPSWHRIAGRVLVPVGLVVALSGIWMAVFYAIVPADTPLLSAFRLFFGTAMAVCIVLGFAAIRKKDVESHQAWMRRAYAIGLGAGTQAVTQLPLLLIFGPPDSLRLALMMGGAWILNLAVAEYLIRRQKPRPPRLATV
jgi:uncharacterized membrane protein